MLLGGNKHMRTTVTSFVALAALAALAVAALYIGRGLPWPLHTDDGSGIILFGLVVYVACGARLAVSAARISHTKAILLSRYRSVFMACAVALLAYTTWASLVLWGVMTSTDL